jgi:nucleotide-binding universal stress UspA family protein
MYKKILVSLALDHGHGYRAIEIARRLLTEGGEIVAVHVLEQVPGFASLYVTDKNDQKIRNLAEDGIAERIGEVKDAEAVVLVGHPGRTITDYAEKIGADCIVVGSHKPGLQDFFLGSTAARIVRHSPCSVHVLR